MKLAKWFLMVGWAAVFAAGTGGAQAQEAARKKPVLDGKKKTFVVVGYSTSYQWPAVLGKMLDEHEGEKGKYIVKNAVVGGSPVAKWLGLTSEQDRQKTFGKMVQNYFDPGDSLGGAPKPTVALLQQSLQWVFPGDRRAGIRGPNDIERIKQGADALEKLAGRIEDLGVETVFISMHIYKVTMEPAIGNEKYALEKLLERKIPFIRPGPELWEPTKKIHPDGFAADKVHPNEIGARVMAAGWYRALAGKAAKEEIVEKAMAGEYDGPARRRGTRQQGERQQGNRQAGAQSDSGRPDRFADRDANKDGVLTKDEFPESMMGRYNSLDANKGGKVTRAEFDASRSRGRQGGTR